MKKTLSLIFVILFIFLFSVKSYSQGAIPVNIYTPHGSLVPNAYQRPEEYNSIYTSTKEYMDKHTIDWGLELIDSASKTYNCHGYAWHMIRNNGDRVWIGSDGISGSESIYWLDGSYEEVPEQCCEIISYTKDHSAVQTEDCREHSKYKSKLAEGH